MSEGWYWDDTVICPRKAFSHIYRERCLEMHDHDLCGSCTNNKTIVQQLLKEQEKMKRRREECRSLGPERKRKKT